MKAIKALVIGMGVLIVTGVVLLIYGIVHTQAPVLHAFGGATPSTPPASPTAVAPSAPLAGSPQATSAPAPYFSAEVMLPAGAKVEHIGMNGEMLVLYVTGGASADRILVVDSRSGKVTGTILLTSDGR